MIDIVQACNLGLMRAVEKFDPTRGAIAFLPMDIEGLSNLRLGLFKTMVDSVMPEIAFS
jgi:hypothetical protein